MKAYDAVVPLKLPPVTDVANQLSRLELSSVCFERGGENVSYRKFKKNSQAIRKFTPSVRQGKTWREMSGKPVVLSGSTERTHGKKQNHDGRVAAKKIITFHAEYFKKSGN